MATSSSSTTRQQQHEMVNAFEEIASPSCRGYPSSSSMPSKVPWDVFINHRGIDVKHTLAKAAYDTLHHMQVQVFLDMEGIEPGDLIPMEIQEAMNSALLHIAIFSKNYAQSPWCLSELSFILNTGTKIIPIFYHTEPSDLRYAVKGKGIYADSFDEHVRKGRYSSDKIQEWKMALNTASFISGYQLHDDNWGWVLESLEISVAKMMRKKPLELSTVPVGLDQIVEDFEKHTNDDSGEIVGIVGLGGCGKTTLAKELYNRKCASYHRSSFLYEVREQAHQGKLPRLQKKLLEDLRLQGSSFKNVNAGIDILADRLRSQRVLIVLDDLDDMDQMDALLPAKDKLGSGSLIIVTTRKLDLLTSLGITSIYRMKELNPFHAKQLFCCYAFSHSDPLHGFEDLVEKFVNACCRLPLSLKVIGRQLCKKPKEYWESQLHKLSRKLPDRITDTLKISYEALDEEEQDVFLDVACFFIGEQKSLAIAVWDGSGWSGVHSWETLMNRCLVELDDQNRIRMHDHLRDLGRKIAEQKSPYRIWFPEQIDNIQEQTKIRGIMAATIDSSGDYSKTCLSAYSPPSEKWLELTKCFSRIKLLVFKADYFVESFWLQCCRGLLWIRIFGFNHTNLVFFFNSFENLRVLELYEVERLESLWGEYDKPPLQLRELIVDFRNSTSFLQMSPTNYFQGFPRSIGLLQHLEKIVFSGEGFCITDLPQEFCHLRSLKHLELTRFEILLSLPSRFGNLTNLRHLVLSHCWELSTLPVSFKQLARLRYLDFSGCRKLRFPSDILVNMTKLEYMNFDGVWELQELPHHFTQQVSLTELNLDKTSLRNAAAKIISQLKKLEVLTIGSDFLTRFPASIGDLSCLTSLSIHLCPKLESLPDSVGRLNQLQRLSILSSGLKSLPETLKQMSNLQYLGIFGCPLAALPFGSSFTSSSLHKLKEIRLHDTRLSTISISEDCCPSLEIVELLTQRVLKEIETLPATVKRLELYACNSMKNMRGIGRLKNLEYLRIQECPELDELPGFAQLTSLRVLEIEGSSKVQKLQGLENLRSMETLKAHSSSWRVPAIRSLGHMERLSTLHLSADKIAAIEPCIQTIKKWPCEMIICARTVGSVKSIVSCFSFPELDVVDSFPRGNIDNGSRTLKCPESHSSNGAILCFVINCTSEVGVLEIWRGGKGGIQPTSETRLMRKGRWVWIGVYDSASVAQFYCTRRWNEAQVVPEKGMLVMGEDGKIKEATKQVVARLKR